MTENKEKLEAFGKLIDVLNRVRVGCPWDREQTMESLRSLTVEECYELVDAITVGDWENVKEELGDVLMHIVMYSRIAEEQNLFDLADVSNFVAEKLVYRHPHVFGEVNVSSSDEVSTNWEKLKKKKKKEGGVLSGVPNSLPAVIKAYRMQQKAANNGFEWENKEDVWDKVTEELSEVREAISEGEQNHIEEEFGDLMFAVINAARMYGVDPENALSACNLKFKTRFEYIEKCCKEDGIELEEAGLERLDGYWNDAKKE